MKKKKLSRKKIIVCSLISVITIGIIIGIVVKNNMNKTNSSSSTNVNKCSNIKGGSFSIIFNTNSDNKINDMNVCVSCPPDSYKDLPVPTYEGYTFDGWFYDKELTKKVEETNTSEVLPIQKKDKNNCVIGYENINLYAKWNKEEQKTEQVTSDEANSFDEEKADETNTFNEEEPPVEDYTPELDISTEEINNEINNNPSEEDLIRSTSMRKPTMNGRYNSLNDIIVAPMGPIYSVSNGKVVKIAGNSTLSEYYKTNVCSITIITLYNEQLLYITYDLTRPSVNVGDFVTDETLIGYMPRGGNVNIFITPSTYRNKVRLNTILPLEPEWNNSR